MPKIIFWGHILILLRLDVRLLSFGVFFPVYWRFPVSVHSLRQHCLSLVSGALTIQSNPLALFNYFSLILGQLLCRNNALSWGLHFLFSARYWSSSFIFSSSSSDILVEIFSEKVYNFFYFRLF